MEGVIIYFVVLVIFGILSLPLYVFLICVVLAGHHTEYKSSFYRLFISQGLIDIFCTIFNYALIRLPPIGFLSGFFEQHQTGFWPRLAMVSSHYFTVAQMIGTVLLGLNRYTAIVTPAEHEDKWKRKKLRLAIALQWTLPLPLLSFRVFQDAQYERYSGPNTWRPVLRPVDYGVNASVAMGVYFTLLVPSLFFNMSALSSYYKQRLHLSGTLERRSLRVEFHLLVYSLLTLVCMSLLIVYQALLCVFNFNENMAARDAVNIHFFWISDIFALSAPWLLLATSTVIRNRCRTFFRRRVTKNEKSTAFTLRVGVRNEESLHFPMHIKFDAS